MVRWAPQYDGGMTSTAGDWQLALTSHLAEAQRPLIVVMGPTASGKTSISITIANDLLSKLGKQGEVINADSRQLYRGCDIGTAKITEEEMQGVPHHLIDILDPNEEAAAGWYQVEAKRIIDEVLSRGNVPILVGGSMLYISTITDGLTLAPEPDPAFRKRLMDEYDRDGGVSLHQRLSEVDPETAARIHPRNKPRLVRAVEIYELCKEPKSEAVPKSELRSSKAKCEYDLFILGVEWPREQLHQRINERTRQMFTSGFVNEVKSLIDQGYTKDDPGLKSTGYREIAEKLEEGIDPSSLSGDEELIEKVAARTRQYAKRQVTWWRRDSRINWITN